MSANENKEEVNGQNEDPAEVNGNGENVKDENGNEQEDGGPTTEQVYKTVGGILAKIKNEAGMKPEEKVDTLCILVQKIIEENAVLKSDLGLMSDQVKKSIQAKDAVKMLNEAYKKQIELVKEESELKLKDEACKRADCINSYQTTMNDLATLLETHTGQNSRLREENVGMADKLKMLLEEGTNREEKISNIITEYQLRIQLMEHQITKAQIEKAEVKADLTKERLEIYKELELERERSANSEETVRLLKEQGSIYQEQLNDMTNGAGNTNKTMLHFKTQIEKLNQRMVELDKDTQQWREKYEVSSQQVKKMNALSLEREKEVAQVKKKLESMIKLNKSLSTERGELINKLSAYESPNGTSKEE